MKTKVYFNPELVPSSAQTALQALFFCPNIAKLPSVFGQSVGRGVTYFLDLTAEIGSKGVLRHYYRGGLIGRYIQDRYLFLGVNQTRAYQEFELLKKLHQLGLPVPRPIAFAIKRSGLSYQAEILLEWLDNTQDLSKLLQTQRLSADQYQQLGRLIGELHRHHVFHADLNIHNIMLDGNGKFWLIDFDKCQFVQGDKWQAQNLSRLHRSFVKEQKRLNIQFSESDWQHLLHGYQEKR